MIGVINKVFTIVLDSDTKHFPKDPIAAQLFIVNIQNHFNRLLEIRGYVFLNELLSALDKPAIRDGAIGGWWREEGSRDIDLQIIDQSLYFVKLLVTIDGTIFENLPGGLNHHD